MNFNPEDRPNADKQPACSTGTDCASPMFCTGMGRCSLVDKPANDNDRPMARSVEVHAAQAGVDPRFAAATFQDGRDLVVGARAGDGMVGLAHGGFGVSVVSAGGEPAIPGMSVKMLDVDAADHEARMDALFLRNAGDQLVDACHGASAKAGWWRNLKTGTDHIHEVRAGTELGRALVGQKLMLAVSEVSEAMEGHRKGLMDDKLPQYPMVLVELADAVIRECDLAGALIPPDAPYTFGEIIAAKLAFNAVRPDHKLEARAAAGGKAY
jgi:hypothetical protein